MKNLTLRNLTKVCNGIWHGDNALLDQEISAITTDSRKIEKGCLFVPIVGERVDAHQFMFRQRSHRGRQQSFRRAPR